ncbi:MAG: hypothetical protein QOJ07_3907 [Thermoleophilaceae bacterium]|jgi:hypothetical protein|nr:hypothetical protein [Thermoleophilaceae bacterium]
MAQTKRKRRRKHRGTQAGNVEARGRTSRPSGTRARAKPQNKTEARAQAREKRLERYDTPPTWRNSAKKSVLMALVFGVVLLALLKRSPASAVAGAALMTVMYLPLTYYTDRFFYNRRRRQKNADRR